MFRSDRGKDQSGISRGRNTAPHQSKADASRHSKGRPGVRMARTFLQSKCCHPRTHRPRSTDSLLCRI